MTNGLIKLTDIGRRVRFSHGVTHGYVDNASTLTTYPQAQQQQEKAFIDSNIKVSIIPVTPGRAGERAMGLSLNSARYLSNRWGPPQGKAYSRCAQIKTFGFPERLP